MLAQTGSRSVCCVLCDIVTGVKCDGRRDQWTEDRERWEVWADITATMFPTMGHISNLSANKQFINVGQMKCIHCNKWSVVHNIWIQNVGGPVADNNEV